MARPTGSKNQAYPFLRSIPPCCRVCGSKKLNAVPGYDALKTPGGGTLPDGLQYLAIERQLKECADCHQRFIVLSYLGNVPAIESGQPDPAGDNRPADPTTSPATSSADETQQPIDDVELEDEAAGDELADEGEEPAPQPTKPAKRDRSRRRRGRSPKRKN